MDEDTRLEDAKRIAKDHGFYIIEKSTKTVPVYVLYRRHPSRHERRGIKVGARSSIGGICGLVRKVIT
jgi:hypothetical protein